MFFVFLLFLSDEKNEWMANHGTEWNHQLRKSLSLNFRVRIDLFMEPAVVFGGGDLCLIQSFAQVFRWQISAGNEKIFSFFFVKSISFYSQTLNHLHKDFRFEEITAAVVSVWWRAAYSLPQWYWEFLDFQRKSGSVLVNL